MKTLQAVFATDKFVALVLVGFDDAIKLGDQIVQCCCSLISCFNVSFKLCLLVLLRRYAVIERVQLFAQIIRSAIIAAGIIASTTTIPRIRNDSLAGLARHTSTLRITSTIPFFTITILVR